MSQFRLAILGAGRWGTNHIRTAQRLFPHELLAVCDPNSDALNKIDSKTADLRLTTNPDDIFDSTDVTAVIIATPAPSHFELAKKALKAGKDVLVEKPLCLKSSDAIELEYLANQSGRILMVGHVLLYHPAIGAIKNIIDQGKLGRIQYIYSNRLNHGSVRQEENILWSFAPHDIAVLDYLLGKPPIDVTASGTINLTPGIHDTTLTVLRYENKIQAHIFVSWLHPFKEQRLVITGDRSMLVFEDHKPDNKLVLHSKGFDLIDGKLEKRDNSMSNIELGECEPLAEELRDFKNSVLTRKQPLASAASGITVLKILEQAQQSLGVETNNTTGASPLTKRISQFGSDVKIHPSACIDDGCIIGSGSKIWHYSHIHSKAKIGNNVSIGQNVNIADNVTIGNFVKIQNNVSVYEGVELEDYVFCGPSMVFTNVVAPRCEFPQRGGHHYKKTLVHRGASLGANSTILCGNTIGKYAFIGAGAVVTHDVPDFALVVGNPARVIGWMCRCGNKLQFSDKNSVCTRCASIYSLAEDKVSCLKDNSNSASGSNINGVAVHGSQSST